MTKYKKFILITYVIIAILMVVGINVRSVKREMRTDIDLTTATRIFDKADLFSDDEEKKLDKELRKVIKSEKTDIAIVTTADAEGKEAKKYAEDFYTEHGFGYDKEKGTGILLLIDMDTSLTGKRKIWISGCGDAKKYITNDIATKISNDKMKENCSKGKYYLASSVFLDEAKYYMNRTVPMPRAMTSSVILLVVSLAVTAVIIFFKVKNFGMKVTTSAATYLNGNAVKTNSRRDNYLGTTVTTRVIERNNDSGSSGSSGSSGGGGSDFSGGGADF